VLQVNDKDKQFQELVIALSKLVPAARISSAYPSQFYHKGGGGAC